jgi:hypothetical protein
MEGALPALVVCALAFAVVQLAYRWNHDGAGTALKQFPWISLVLFALALPEWRRMRRRLAVSADVPTAQADQAGDGQDGSDRGQHE